MKYGQSLILTKENGYLLYGFPSHYSQNLKLRKDALPVMFSDIN